MALAAVAGSAALAGCGSGRDGAAPPAPRSSAIAPGEADGRRIFVAAGCGSCHALRAAGTHGTNGPDFDTSERLDRAQLRSSLTEGANGMPSYAGRLTPRQMDAVTRFLYDATH